MILIIIQIQIDLYSPLSEVQRNPVSWRNSCVGDRSLRAIQL